jgi:raffinose/stachyose/melibiose transport system permease protein
MTRPSLKWLTEIVMFAFALIFIFPVFLIAINSFKTNAQILTSPFSMPKELYMGNIRNVLEQMHFFDAFMNTVYVTVLGVIGVVLFSSMCGYKLSRTSHWISQVIFFICISPMLISFSSIMITLLKISKTFHLLDSLTGLSVIYWGMMLPGNIFLFHGFVKGVPRELEEAAAIDGSGPLRTFFQIVFPIMTPITSTIIILTALGIWNDFLLPLLIVGNTTSNNTLVVAAYGFLGKYSNDWGGLLTGLSFTAVPIIILYLFMQRFIISGISAGALKG